MKKNKKDYLSKTLLLQFCVCLVLFGLLFTLKKTNNKLFESIEKTFSEKLQENLNIEEAESVFSNILNNGTEATEAETEQEYVPLEEPSLSAEIIATGGKDVKVTSENDIPDNVSTDDYTLNQKIVLPVEGKVTSEFGTRIHPVSGDLRFHSGIDIAAEEGTNIYAAFNGTVVEADYDKWNGNYIKIKHDNNIMTVYCHCKKLNVKKGQKIRAGEVIAIVGSTGVSTGPHLHFELRLNDISYNPQKALDEAINAF